MLMSGPDAAIDRPTTVERSDAVVGPSRIACWASLSPDHLVGAQQYRFRYRYPERFRSPKVDDHLKLGWLLNW